MDHIHFLFADVEVCAGVVVCALFGVIVQNLSGEVEGTFKPCSWAIVVTHVIYSVENSVAHGQLLFVLYAHIIARNRFLDKRNPAQGRVF